MPTPAAATMTPRKARRPDEQGGQHQHPEAAADHDRRGQVAPGPTGTGRPAGAATAPAAAAPSAAAAAALRPARRRPGPRERSGSATTSVTGDNGVFAVGESQAGPSNRVPRSCAAADRNAAYGSSSVSAGPGTKRLSMYGSGRSPACCVQRSPSRPPSSVPGDRSPEEVCPPRGSRSDIRPRAARLPCA